MVRTFQKNLFILSKFCPFLYEHLDANFSNLTVDKQNVKKFKSLNTIITDGESVSWGH